ncbi:WAT1-related protein At5g07050-like [Primulina tabacum]|uniref:WAT1-related protein At5g07050-like n=1 Tax=Primulina tabacum TaxID=48773 RepID=UPI003F5A6391
MEGKGWVGRFLEKAKLYIAMICLQFGHAGMNIITKVSLDGGMSHYVLVVYRHSFATVAIAPFALLLERKVWPKITFTIFLQLFFLGLLGPVIDQNLYYAGLKFTSPTYACALSNMLPAMTFVMAVICRMEKLDLMKIRCQAKVVGTLITVCGAMLMTLYKGDAINMVWSKYIHPRQSYAPQATAAHATQEDWIKGSILLIIATLAWASFFILQAITLRKYTAQLSLTALVCFLGTLQSIGVTLVMEHKRDAWVIGWDMNLLAAAYAGIVSSGIAYYVQGLVMQKRGPVFVTSFSPLMMIIVAIMGSFILAEKIFVGGVLGAVLIVIGLYAVLWGKCKEKREGEILEPEKGATGNNQNVTEVDDIEAKFVELEKNGVKKLFVLAVSAPMPQPPPMIAIEAPKLN